MKRRSFLKNMGLGYVTAASLMYGNPLRPRFQIANAQQTNGKTLIVIFQKGGNDGVNTIVPYGDPDYYALRPTIAVAPPDLSNPAAAIDLDGFFGLHPGLADFEPLYFAGDLAILPAVHYPNATRSHFDGQPLIETGASQPGDNLDGWLNRHLVSQPGSLSSLRAAGYAHGEDAGVPDSLRGPAVVSTFNDLTTFGLGLPAAEEAALLQRLTAVYDQSADPSKVYSALVHDFGRTVIGDVGLIQSMDFQSYIPANGAVYPTTNLGRSMKQTAQLIKEGIGLEIAALSRHHWDTHKDQGGADDPNGDHYGALSDFSGSIAALYADLGGLMNDVIVLTMTEFGRTAAENASGGTDHGNAAAWFAVGPSVTGGMYLGGGWPGLGPEQLHDNRDLVHTIDYRDVYAEVLVRHLGNNDLAAVLPGHTYTPVDFLLG